MTRSLFALAAAVLLAGCGSSAPPQADIRSAYQQALPGLLALKELELENLRNSGSEERPVWTARTIATLEVREPTYEIQTVEGGVRILKPVRAQGETFSSYGTLRSERSGEGWRHRFQSDGSSNPMLGRPRSDYGPDALIADSAEARALLERIEQEREAARIAEETRLAEEAAERQRKEQAEAEKKLRIERAVAKHGAAFATDTLGRMVDRGGSRAFLITGNSGSRGRVYGTDLYTCDSNFSRAVVHAGLLRHGETGIVEVQFRAEDHTGFIGSPRNGVDSLNYRRYSACTLRLLERIPTE